MREQPICKCCGIPLTEDLAAWGDLYDPMCWYCWTENEDPESAQTVYGYFPGGDPHDFTPDFELCTPTEIAAWEADCKAWENGEGQPCPPSCRSVVSIDGETTVYFLAPRYGVGVYIARD